MRGLARLVWLCTGGTGLIAGIIAGLTLLNPSANRDHALISVASLIGGGAALGASMWALANMGELPEMQDYAIAGMPLSLPPAQPQPEPAKAEPSPEFNPAERLRTLPPPSMSIAMPAPTPPATVEVEQRQEEDEYQFSGYF